MIINNCAPKIFIHHEYIFLNRKNRVGYSEFSQNNKFLNHFVNK